MAKKAQGKDFSILIHPVSTSDQRGRERRRRKDLDFHRECAVKRNEKSVKLNADKKKYASQGRGFQGFYLPIQKAKKLGDISLTQMFISMSGIKKCSVPSKLIKD